MAEQSRGIVVGRSPRFAQHNPGLGHPERPERWQALEQALEGVSFQEVTPRAATRTELCSVHTPAHVEAVEAAKGKKTEFDPDTRTSEASIDAALLAAGTTIDVAKEVAKSTHQAGFSLVRPPGHHAEATSAMGFCFLNNIALAARTLLKEGLAERVAIYDWDVHHGNGTQDIFYEDGQVLFASTHQSPLYPGTGAATEQGVGPGLNATVNLTLPEGAGDTQLLEANQYLRERVSAFAPDIILISAGFDAHRFDPLGGLEITTEGFRELALRWRELAEILCQGRIVGVLEGGYHLDALSESVRCTLEAWS